MSTLQISISEKDLLKFGLTNPKVSFEEFLAIIRAELVRKTSGPTVQNPPDLEHQLMIEYILSYKKADPSFGDAAEWQRKERTERELPWAA